MYRSSRFEIGFQEACTQSPLPVALNLEQATTDSFAFRCILWSHMTLYSKLDWHEKEWKHLNSSYEAPNGVNLLIREIRNSLLNYYPAK